MKKLLILFILVSGLLSTSKINATHLAGMDITYNCIGGNDYIITLTFYRDCSGIAESASVNVSFDCSGNPQYNFSVNLQKKSGANGLEITYGCAAAPTRCVPGGVNYGIREWIYQGQVTLPDCNSWKMSHSMCCRNPSNTIQSSTSQSAYIESLLNNLDAPSNSSPIFSNKPVTLLCYGQTFNYSHGAYDPDGDSLSYEWITPKTSPTSTVNYLPGYSKSHAIPSSPPIYLDSVTGSIIITPTINIVSHLAIRVNEWRKINGVTMLIGSIIRDMLVNVVSCNNTLPELSGMDTSLSHKYNPNDTIFYIQNCLGAPLSFDISAFDVDTAVKTFGGYPNKMSISWNNGIPWGSFNVYHNGTDSAYANFSWTPTSADVSNTPHCFTATVRDGACPYNGSQTFSYCIQVRGMLVQLHTDTTICHGEDLALVAISDSTTVNYTWKLNGNIIGNKTIDSTLVFHSGNYLPGIYIIRVETDDGQTTSQCPGIDEIKVRVTYQPDVNLGNDTILCYGETITLDAGLGYYHLWNNGSTSQTITVSHPFTATYRVIVYGDPDYRCMDSDTIKVYVNNPKVDLGGDIFLYPSQLTTLDAGVGFSSYLWSTGDTSQTLVINSNGLITGAASFSVTVTDSAGCQASDSVNVILIVGVDEKNRNRNISILQNPVNEVIILEIDGFSSSELNVEVVDLRGSIIYNEEFSVPDNNFTKQINISTLQKGVYFIRFYSKDFRKAEKLFVQ